MRQGYVFLSESFNIYIEAILGKRYILAGFIFGLNLNNIDHADKAVLMTDTEAKVKDILDRIVKENKSLIVRRKEV